MSTRTFEDKPASRDAVPLLVSLFGPSGGGKTFSALRLATGIQQVVGGEIHGIDTEARRMLAYADRFKFRHIDFRAPFGPLDYLAAIEHSVNRGARVIVIDSMSHEHEGPGGVLEMHEEIVQKMGGGDRNNFRAWAKPKGERRRMVNSILQMPCNFIFCFRAKEKMKPVPGQQPKELGYMPIAGEEFLYEMTASCLLPPRANGVPCWQTQYDGERAMMKLPEQFLTVLNDGKPLDEAKGRQLAEWARGGAATPPPVAPTFDLQALTDVGDTKASEGGEALRAWWVTLPPRAQHALKDKLAKEWKPLTENKAAA